MPRINFSEVVAKLKQRNDLPEAIAAAIAEPEEDPNNPYGHKRHRYFDVVHTYQGYPINVKKFGRLMNFRFNVTSELISKGLTLDQIALRDLNGEIVDSSYRTRYDVDGSVYDRKNGKWVLDEEETEKRKALIKDKEEQAASVRVHNKIYSSNDIRNPFRYSSN